MTNHYNLSRHKAHLPYPSVIWGEHVADSEMTKSGECAKIVDLALGGLSTKHRIPLDILRSGVSGLSAIHRKNCGVSRLPSRIRSRPLSLSGVYKEQTYQQTLERKGDTGEVELDSPEGWSLAKRSVESAHLLMLSSKFIHRLLIE